MSTSKILPIFLIVGVSIVFNRDAKALPSFSNEQISPPDGTHYFVNTFGGTKNVTCQASTAFKSGAYGYDVRQDIYVQVANSTFTVKSNYNTFSVAPSTISIQMTPVSVSYNYPSGTYYIGYQRLCNLTSPPPPDEIPPGEGSLLIDTGGENSCQHFVVEEPTDTPIDGDPPGGGGGQPVGP